MQIVILTTYELQLPCFFFYKVIIDFILNLSFYTSNIQRTKILFVTFNMLL